MREVFERESKLDEREKELNEREAKLRKQESSIAPIEVSSRPKSAMADAVEEPALSLSKGPAFSSACPTGKPAVIPAIKAVAEPGCDESEIPTIKVSSRPEQRSCVVEEPALSLSKGPASFLEGPQSPNKASSRPEQPHWGSGDGYTLFKAQKSPGVQPRPFCASPEIRRDRVPKECGTHANAMKPPHSRLPAACPCTSQTPSGTSASRPSFRP
jgi:hypothetical protein